MQHQALGYVTSDRLSAGAWTVRSPNLVKRAVGLSEEAVAEAPAVKQASETESKTSTVSIWLFGSVQLARSISPVHMHE